jgi:hypothetical protein
VYVSDGRTTFEPDNFLWETTPGIISKPVVGKTELILPDEWPEFPSEPGTYYIGITSRDDLGNQSDPFLLSGRFKFLAPPAPSTCGIEYFEPLMDRDSISDVTPFVERFSDIIFSGTIGQ